MVTFEDKQGVMFKGFFTHGRRLIRTIADDPVRRTANEKLQLKQHLKNKMGDCLIMAKGHCHRLIVSDPIESLYLMTENEEIHQRYTHSAHKEYKFIHPDHRWYCATGSFLKTFGEKVSSYAEVGEMDPVELGYVKVIVRDRTIAKVERIVVG